MKNSFEPGIIDDSENDTFGNLVTKKYSEEIDV